MYVKNKELNEKMLIGVEKLVEAIACTLGPRGRNVVLKMKNKGPIITKDGATIAGLFKLDDIVENLGVQIVRQASEKTADIAGDGTTTSAVLSLAILREANKFLTSGIPAINLKRGIDCAVQIVLKYLDDNAIPIKRLEDIQNIATISANGDEILGKLVATAIDKCGKDGSLLLEQSRTEQTYLEVVEGFRFDSGYTSNAFVTDERRGIVSYENPLILITDEKVEFVEQIMPTLQLVARDGRSLIIIADSLIDQAHAALIANVTNGNMKICGVKPPRFGEERRNILKDLCLSTGATFMSREAGASLKNIKLSDFGNAKKVEITKGFTTIKGGKGDYNKIEERIESLKEEIKQTSSLQECERIQERITRLTSGVSVIYIGAPTEAESIGKLHAIEDAVAAVRSAQLEGILSGGGLALRNCSSFLTDQLATMQLSDEEKIGYKIVLEACKMPLKQIAKNANCSPDIVLQGTGNEIGFNASTEKYVNMVECGIIDPCKVVKTAVLNASSVAGAIIMSECAYLEE